MGSKLQTWYWTQGPLAEELKKAIGEGHAHRAGPAALAVAVALLTVSWQTLRAAGANPIASLRSE